VNGRGRLEQLSSINNEWNFMLMLVTGIKLIELPT